MIDTPVQIITPQAEQRQFINHPHGWMLLSVAITGVISLAMVTLPLVSSIVLGTVVRDIAGFVWLIILELLLVGYLAPALPGRPAFSASSAFLGLAIPERTCLFIRLNLCRAINRRDIRVHSL